VIVAVPREIAPLERRVALVPEAVKALQADGLEVRVERGAGAEAGFDDAAYQAAGARLEPGAEALLPAADLVLKVQPPRERAGGGHEVELLRPGAALIGFLRPLERPDLARRLAERGVTSFALELLPRITRAQSMDALSSQGTIAGYRAVLLAAAALPKLFPMLVTAAGTLAAARVLVIGAGVAGLQAIATARRLGAVVEAYDTRPAVREQVESLGARFVALDLETADAEAAGGYARAQSEEFYRRQREQLARRIAAADVVITTALVPGQRAPLLIEEKAVRGMRRGSVIVDLAAEAGGNCACTRPGETVQADGVLVIGATDLPSQAPAHASQMYARNLVTLVRHLVRGAELRLDLSDEITRGALLTHQGKIASEGVRARAEASASAPA
jgi:NAD(P) transhydrogenase subunit alpha